MSAQDLSPTRRERLLKLIEDEYGGVPARFIEATDWNQSLLSQILTGRKRIGEKMARNLEALAGKPARWLDQAETLNLGALSDAEAALISAFRALPDGWQYYLRHKAEELRHVAEALPKFVFESFKPLPPEDRYWQWEQDLNEYIRGRRDNNHEAAP